MEQKNFRSRNERGNILFVAIISLTIAFSLVLLVSEMSLRNYRTTDRHLRQEDAYFAAQGATDAIVADFKVGFDNAKKEAATPLSFISWLEGRDQWKGLEQKLLPVKPDDKIVSSTAVPEWEGRPFNSAVISRARVTRTTTGTAAMGYEVTLKVDVEALPADGLGSHEAITATRLFSITNQTPFKGADFAILTENISCTFCHLTVSTIELQKNMENPEILTRNNKKGDPESHYRRALVGTTKYLNTRFDESDTEIHGTLYVGKDVNIQNHNNTASLAEYAKTGQLRMAELFNDWDQKDAADNVSLATVKSNGDRGEDGRINALLSSKPKVAKDNTEQGQQLYEKYPGSGDYRMDKEFPSPFKDVGDSNGIGARNRVIDPFEMESTKAEATGSLTVKHFQRIPYNTNQDYATKQYTFNENKLPAPKQNDIGDTIKTGEQSNLILIGTKENPINLDGNIVIEGDVVIKGYVTGKGLLKATGNVYIPNDLMYNNKGVGTESEIFSKDTMVGLAAGGSIVIGDYISKVTSSGAQFDLGKPDLATYETSFSNFTNQQLAIYNREELTRTLKRVPGKGGQELSQDSSYNIDNPVYDPSYTPRYYTMYPDTPAYAFIKDNYQGAKFDVNQKSWITGEIPYSIVGYQMNIAQVPNTIKNQEVKPQNISIHPNWISPQNMLEIIADEEAQRKGTLDGKPFRIDGLLYTNNAIINVQRKFSQTKKSGTWERDVSSHRGQMEINGSIIAPDLGMLVTKKFNINYDRRAKVLLNEKIKTDDWIGEVTGFARFDGPMTP